MFNYLVIQRAEIWPMLEKFLTFFCAMDSSFISLVNPFDSFSENVFKYIKYIELQRKLFHCIHFNPRLRTHRPRKMHLKGQKIKLFVLKDHQPSLPITPQPKKKKEKIILIHMTKYFKLTKTQVLNTIWPRNSTRS